MVEKHRLRKACLAERKALGDDEYRRRCNLLHQHFIRWDSNLRASVYHVFLPIVKKREPDTWPLINYLMDHDKKVVVSKSDLNSNLLTHYYLEERSQLQENKWGIPEPTEGIIASTNQIDVVLIPLLTFDGNGHRIGYGKGYYDRFLKDCRSDVLKLGISILSPAQTAFEVEPHDIPMNACITHEQIYRFGKTDAQR